MTERLLSGLDGANPLAFLAALGVLRLCHAAASDTVRLSWRDEGRWRPLLSGDRVPEPVDAVMGDLATWSSAPELSLEYKKQSKKERKIVRDLKAPRAAFKDFARRAREAARTNRRWADFVAAYATDVAVDGNGNTKPTALHFTAGQQTFLEMVSDLAAGLTPEHIQEALYGPWRYESELAVLRWDAVGERLYALRASNPGKETPKGVPGADWLAFQALPLFPSYPVGSRIATTCFSGRGKDMEFRWPIWTAPANLDTVRTLLMHCPDRLDEVARHRGIAMVLKAEVRRSDHGYGNFAAPVPA